MRAADVERQELVGTKRLLNVDWGGEPARLARRGVDAVAAHDNRLGSDAEKCAASPSSPYDLCQAQRQRLIEAVRSEARPPIGCCNVARQQIHRRRTHESGDKRVPRPVVDLIRWVT